MIHFPCEIDNVRYENARLAYRAVFLPKNISYYRLSRALKRGDREFLGHKISRVERRYEIAPPDEDGADLIPVPAAESLKKEHKRGEPLIRYPLGESPLERGLPQRWH